MERSDRHRLMARPLCPAPTTIVEVRTEPLVRIGGAECQLTSTLMFVGFVMMS